MDIERFAIMAAKGNNGGEWATHYTEEQKEYWRRFVRELLAAAVAAERERCAKICEEVEAGEMMFDAKEAAAAAADMIRRGK